MTDDEKNETKTKTKTNWWIALGIPLAIVSVFAAIFIYKVSKVSNKNLSKP